MYPREMRDSIKRVEETRGERLRQIFPRITLEEKQELLRKYHPNFIPGSMRKLKIGVNKGSKLPNELADLLEGRSLINPKEFDLSEIDHNVDVLIIGAGGAGTIAGIWAKQYGADVLLVTKLGFGHSNTTMYQGGTQVPIERDDSPGEHHLDTVGGGNFKNNPELVELLVKNIPFLIKWLEDLGVMWDKNPDGSFQTHPGGGTSFPRLVCAGDYTGKEVMQVLRDEAKNRGIPVLERSPAVELVMDDKGQVAGAILKNLDTEELSLVRAKTTILATGGSGRLHYQGFPTTNHYGATGDGRVLAYRVGVEFVVTEAPIQYHPTGVAYPGQIVGQLVTEKVRSLGAQLINVNGEQFINPLETRDAVASAIIRECGERNNGINISNGILGIWLDSPMIDIIHGKGTVEKKLPAMYAQFDRFGIDMSQEPILVYPVAHYHQDGIAVDACCRTNIPGLLAAGEDAGGADGEGRLMGNSSGFTIVSGWMAGVTAAEQVKEIKLGRLTLEYLDYWESELRQAGIWEERPFSPLLLPDYTRRVRRI